MVAEAFVACVNDVDKIFYNECDKYSHVSNIICQLS